MTREELARAVYGPPGGFSNQEARRIVELIFDIISQAGAEQEGMTPNEELSEQVY
jgi:nucleoid DNA-binding protein